MSRDERNRPRWFASFSEFQQLIGPTDWVLIDATLPRALGRRIEAATPHVLQYRTGDLEEVRAQICHVRTTSEAARVFVLAPSQPSSRAFGNEVRQLEETCQRYGAILLVDLSDGGPGEAAIRVERIGPCAPEGDW